MKYIIDERRKEISILLDYLASEADGILGMIPKRAYRSKWLRYDIRRIINAIDSAKSSLKDTRFDGKPLPRKLSRMLGDVSYMRPDCIHCADCYARNRYGSGELLGVFVNCAAYDDNRRPIEYCNTACCEYCDKEDGE